MRHLLWFIKLRFLMIRNSIGRDTKTITRTILITAAVIYGQILLARIFHRSVFGSLTASEEIIRGMLPVFFFVAVLWIYLLSFVQSISTFARNFHQSPDMHYLISIPIPFDHVFLFRFIEHILGSAKSMLFLFFPFLTALGMWAGAPLAYYIAIVPLYILLSIIPCAIGVMVAMISLKLLPAKIFSMAATILAFAINVVFAVLFSRAEELPAAAVVRLIEFLTRPWTADLIPLTAGVRLFSAAITGKGVAFAAVFLIASSALLLAIAFQAAKKLYYDGWAKSQFVASRISGRRTVRAKRSKRSGVAVSADPRESFNAAAASVPGESTSAKAAVSRHNNPGANETISWIKTEWRMAVRNQEMWIGSAFMFFFFLFAVFTFVYGGLFANLPMLGVSLLITIAAIFNIMAVSMLFIPAEITKDKSLWKNRYWLLKTLPFTGRKVFHIQCGIYFIPAYIISLAGIIVYAAFAGMSVPWILLAGLCLLLILYGSAAVYTAVELLSLTEYFEKNALLGNLITIVFPALYGILAAGSIALFLAGDIVAEIAVLSGISAFLRLPIVSVLSVTAVIAALVFSRQVFERAWKQLEI